LPRSRIRGAALAEDAPQLYVGSAAQHCARLARPVPNDGAKLQAIEQAFAGRGAMSRACRLPTSASSSQHGAARRNAALRRRDDFYTLRCCSQGAYRSASNCWS